MRANPSRHHFASSRGVPSLLLPSYPLLPAQEMLRTGLPGQLEHFVAYAGSAGIAMVGYGQTRGGIRIVGFFWLYAGILESLQHFSPARHPSIADFAVSAMGALCGGVTAPLLSRCFWRAGNRNKV
jgi:VanZ family protein